MNQNNKRKGKSSQNEKGIFSESLTFCEGVNFSPAEKIAHKNSTKGKMINYKNAFRDQLNVNDDDIAMCLNVLTTENTTSLKSHIEYCQYWCCVADYLIKNKVAKLHEKLLFEIKDYQTDSYIHYVVYQCYELSHKLLEYLMTTFELPYLVESKRIVLNKFDSTILFECLKFIRQVIGTLNYCITVLFTSSKYVQLNLENECIELIQRYNVIRSIGCWIKGNYEYNIPLNNREYENVCRWFYSSIKIIEKHRLQKYGYIEHILSSCQQLILINKGDYYNQQCDIGIASACYKDAESIGMMLNTEEEKTIHHNEEIIKLKEPSLNEIILLYPISTEMSNSFQLGEDPLLKIKLI